MKSSKIDNIYLHVTVDLNVSGYVEADDWPSTCPLVSAEMTNTDHKSAGIAEE